MIELLCFRLAVRSTSSSAITSRDPAVKFPPVRLRFRMPFVRRFLVGATVSALLLVATLGAYARPAASNAASDSDSGSVTNLNVARYAMGIAKSKDGKIFVIGGGSTHGPLNSVEVLDTSASAPQWVVQPAALNTARYSLAVTLGPDGKIYAIGGVGSDFTILDKVEVLDPADANPHWTTLPASLNSPRKGGAAVTGLDGKIYVIGGCDRYGLLSSVEVYDPLAAMPRWIPLKATLNVARQDFAAVTGLDGRIYVLGGFGFKGRPLDSVEALDAVASQWTELPATLPEPRFAQAAVVGPDGKIYSVGGRIGATVPLRKKKTDVAVPAGGANPNDPPVMRFYSSATVPNDHSRVDRPVDLNFSLDTVAVYDPSAKDPHWIRLPAKLGTPRERLGAVVAPDGKFWVIGGVDLTIHPLASVEVVDPAERMVSRRDR